MIVMPPDRVAAQHHRAGWHQLVEQVTEVGAELVDGQPRDVVGQPGAAAVPGVVASRIQPAARPLAVPG